MATSSEMEEDKNVTVEELGKLVAVRVGSDRNTQENLIIHILKAMVAERSGGNVTPSDDMGVFNALGVDDKGYMFEAIKIAGDKSIYSAIAKLLLDDPRNGWEKIRLTVKNHILEKINQDKMIQQEAGV